MAGVRAVVVFVGRSTKRIAVTMAGAALLLGGVVMMITPGPGGLAIIAGLAVLSTEYVWARRALETAKQRAALAHERVKLRRAKAGAPEKAL